MNRQPKNTQEANFELTSRTFLGHVKLSLAHNLATIWKISEGDCVRNLSMESMVVLTRCTTAVWEHVIFARASGTMAAMNTIVEIIHLPLKCRHVEGLSFSGRDQFWQFLHTTNDESGRSSPHS